MIKKIALLTSPWSPDYVISIINGIKSACDKNNLDLYVFACYKFSEPDGTQNTTGFAIFDLINYKDFDGIIITPNLLNDDEIARREAKRILESKVPAVSIAHPIEGMHSVNSGNYDLYKDLIRHLINDHNAKKFAFVGGPENDVGADSNFRAFREVLEGYNIPLIQDFIFLDGDWTTKTAYEQAKKLFELKDRPDAVVCVNDFTAMAVTKAAIEHDIKIPEELKVVGFDDISLSKQIIPSITTISVNAEKMAYEAVNIILNNPKTPESKTIPATMIKRQSCGCCNTITKEQVMFAQNYYQRMDEAQRFTSQLRHLEDVFIKHETVKKLTENLQLFFEKRHAFEGPDFAILLKDEVVKTLNSEQTSDENSRTYGKEVQVITNIENGIPAPVEKIKTKSLIPDNMKSDKPSVFLFLPIFNQRYLHGYFVSKNCTRLLEEKNGYNWTRSVGTIIEKFRQTLIYRTMSEQHRKLSTRDALSDLLNRAGLDSFGIEMFNKNNRENTNTEIIFIDINNMKVINDKHGHLHGDLAVKTVAEAIRTTIPKNYLGFRYGGDEFVVIGPCKKSSTILQKIENQLKQKANSLSLPYQITASFGSKIFEANEKENLFDAIKEADEVMYVKKEEFHKTIKSRN